MRELDGDDGHAVADLMFTVLNNEKSEPLTAWRPRSGSLPRGFGKAALMVDVSVPEHVLHEFLRGLSTDDLHAMVAILEKYSPGVPELAESERLQLDAGSSAASRQR